MTDKKATPFPEEGRCEDLDNAVAIALQLTHQARQIIRIESRQLCPALYHRSECAQAIQTFCLQHPRGRVCILISDPTQIRSTGHLFLPLIQKLTTAIEIRATEEANMHESLMVDDNGFLRLSDTDRYQGHYALQDRRETQTLVEDFQSRWEQGERASSLLGLQI